MSPRFLGRRIRQRHSKLGKNSWYGVNRSPGTKTKIHRPGFSTHERSTHKLGLLSQKTDENGAQPQARYHLPFCYCTQTICFPSFLPLPCNTLSAIRFLRREINKGSGVEWTKVLSGFSIFYQRIHVKTRCMTAG